MEVKKRGWSNGGSTFNCMVKMLLAYPGHSIDGVPEFDTSEPVGECAMADVASTMGRDEEA